MSISVNAMGAPVIGAVKTLTSGVVTLNGQMGYKPGGGKLKSAKSRDYGNSENLYALRSGLMIAKHTSDGSYAPFVIGVSTAALTTSATTLSVSVAQAVELNTRVGASGTFTIVGPPSAAGTVATQTITYSAVNTSTGAITITASGVAYIAGSFICETTYLTPITVVGDGYPVQVDSSITYTDWAHVPMSGILDTTKILDYPSDTSLKTWVKSYMSSTSGNKFIFSDAI
jgi:hypothetical protein